MGGFFNSLFGGGNGGGGGHEIIQPQMPLHPIMEQGLIPAAQGRINASMPWLLSGQRTIDYFNTPQFSHDPMNVPQFNPSTFYNQLMQQRTTANHWQNNLDSFFPSPWGTQLSYTGENGTYRRPTDSPQPPGGSQNPTSQSPFPVGGGGNLFDPNNLERYVARDPSTNSFQGASFESVDQWNRYNGFNPTPQVPVGPNGFTDQNQQQQDYSVWNSLTPEQQTSLRNTGSAAARPRAPVAQEVARPAT